MTRQLEYPENAQHAKDLHSAASVVEVLVALIGQEQGHIIGQYGNQIDKVQCTLGELPLVRRRPKTQHVLEREPSDAQRLDCFQVRVISERVVEIVYGDHVMWRQRCFAACGQVGLGDDRLM